MDKKHKLSRLLDRLRRRRGIIGMGKLPGSAFVDAAGILRSDGIHHRSSVALEGKIKMETKEELDDLTKHQAEAWCRLVAELMIDFGLTSAEPGKIALEQVQHFLRRKLKPEGAASSDPDATEIKEVRALIRLRSEIAASSEHKAGCPALGGYGHGPEPCICGAASSEAIAKKPCPRCGVFNWETDKECSHCAEPLGAASSKPQQEWTTERLAAYLNGGGGTMQLAKDLNAAFAAERKNYAAWRLTVNETHRKELAAAQKVCEIYFNIAAEVIGEDEVRRRRDAKLPPAHSPPAEKSDPSG
jgi:hypothetical protein